MKKWIVAGSMIGGIVILAASRRRGSQYRRLFRRSAKEV
jgi:hypothetical protein